MLLAIIIILLLLGVGGLPTWGYSAGWGLGYGPSGIVGVILIILVIWLLLGHRI